MLLLDVTLAKQGLLDAQVGAGPTNFQRQAQPDVASYEGPNSIRHWLPSLEVKGLDLVLKLVEAHVPRTRIRAVLVIIPSKFQLRCRDCIWVYF